MTRSRSVPRFWIRLVFLGTAVALLWPLPFANGLSDIPVQASPFITVCSLLALKTFKAGMVLGLVFACAAFFRKRWFCRYACPTGLILDGAARIGFRKTAKWKRLPSLGRPVVILTAASAVIGYPLLQWMDPLAVFSSAVSVRNSSDLTAGILAAAGLAVLLAVHLIFGDLWCARICPLGALQDIFTKAKSFAEAGRGGAGRGVGMQGASHAVSGARRTFLAVAAGVGLGFWAGRIGSAREDEALLRPPGAVGEENFSGLCVRCGCCIRTCPSGIIHADTGQAGLAGLLAPVVRYDKKYCLEDCNACTRVCPSGALQELGLEQKNRYKIGEAYVDGSLCFLVRGVNDCDICVRSCPFDAVEVYWDEDKYVAYPNVDPDACNGCGACEVYCPTPEIKAIRIWKTEET